MKTATRPLNMGDAPRVVEILARHFRRDQSFHMAEVGVYRGQTSAAILRTFSACRLWMVDSWEAADPTGVYAASGDGVARLTKDEQHMNMLAAAETTAFANRRSKRRSIHIWKSATFGVELQGFPQIRFDAIFLDAAHDYDSVVADIAAWRPLLRHGHPGSLFIFHDYLHPRNNGRGYGVRQAVDEWAEREGRNLETLGSMAWTVVQ